MEQLIINVADALVNDSNISSSILVNDVVEETIDDILRNYDMDVFIPSEPGSIVEADMKKIFAKALIIAQDRNCLPSTLMDLPRDAEAIASLVDDSLTRIKTAVLVDAEKLYPDQAINSIVDHSVARLKVVSDVMVERGVDTATETAIQVVACKFPPIQLLAPAIREFTKQCTPTIKSVVRKGLDVVSSFAKKTVKEKGIRAIEKVQKVGRKVLSFLGL